MHGILQQVLEEEFKKEREDHENFYSRMIPHRPLKSSLSTPATDTERQKSASFSTPQSHSTHRQHSRSSLQPLDEVVLSTASLSTRQMTNGGKL